MPAPHRVLLLGGSGQLGSAIRRQWEAAQITAPSHEELDICDPLAVAAAMERWKPDTVVNCAAFHNVDRCEREPQTAFAVNALAVNALAEACAQRNVAFVTFSTDYVFDGTAGRPYSENDAPHPLNAYGVSKYAGELLVQRLACAAYVVRTCGVYATRPSSSKGHTFLDRIMTQARDGLPLRIVGDQTVSPTYA